MGGSLLIWVLLVLAGAAASFVLGWYRYERLSCLMVRERYGYEVVHFGKIAAMLPASFAMAGSMIVHDALPSFISRYSAFQYFSFIIISCFIVHGVIVHFLTSWLSTLGEVMYDRKWGRYRYLQMHKCKDDMSCRKDCPFRHRCFFVKDSKHPNFTHFYLRGVNDGEVIIKTSAHPDELKSDQTSGNTAAEP